MTIVVYLDSQDYSKLSDTRISNERLRSVAAELKELAKSPKVKFAYSCLHISESASTSADYSFLAEQRADFLATLCGRNALISIDRLIAAELAKLSFADASPCKVLTPDGTWFPILGDVLADAEKGAAMHEAERNIQQSNANRANRRAAKRFLQARTSKSAPHLVSAIQKMYPMSSQCARLFERFVMGRCDKAALETAFLDTLRDTRYLMRWFAQHYEEMGPVVNWIRWPALEWKKNMETAVDTAKEFQKFEPRLLTQKHWKRVTDISFVSLVQQRLPMSNISEIDLPRLEVRCPGLSTFIRTFYASILNSIIGHRHLQTSDFPDMLHAMYAPYVSVYRADDYMAPIIQKHVSRFGTTVVSKLWELPQQIRIKMAESVND